MYPSAQLKHLALQKELLERRIDVNRARCVIEWHRLRGPIETADRIIVQVRRLAPLLKLLAIPATLALARRRGRPRHTKATSPGRIRLVLKWAPVLLGLVRSWRANRQMRREASFVQRRARSAVP